MALPEFFWQTIFGLYVLAAVVQLAVWWGVFGKLGCWMLHLEQDILDAGQNPSTHHRSPIHPSPIPEPPITHPPVSILICARNEAENLRRHLPAVLAQQYESQWELLVVDDASEDETPLVLRSFHEKFPGRMRVLRLSEKILPGKKYALAQGIAAAKYDLLLCTDADCVPAGPHWLAHMAVKLTSKPETEIVLGYGPLKDLTTLKKLSNLQMTGLWSRYETAFVAAQYFSFALAGMPYMGVGRNLAFKRPIFERVGGFVAHAHILSGDDDLLVNAAANSRNTAICLDPESFVYSDAPKTWGAWLRQKQRHLAAGPAYRPPHKMALGMLALSHFGFYFLFAELILEGFKPMIVVGIFLLRLFSVLFIFGKILRVLREPGLGWRIPWLDPLMAVYYGVVAPCILTSKKRVGWG